MQLEEYLEALEKCPDAELTQELGVYDNWPILLKADFETVVQRLLSSKFRIIETQDYPKHQNEPEPDLPYLSHTLMHASGDVSIQAMNYLPFHIEHGSESDKKRQRRDYNISFLLHGYIRPRARLVNQIGNLAMEMKISLCFPESIGWKYSEDYSRIVYYQP